mmetsp:Transcript_7619/g.14417  ORF Transcript_7619/g.14417 Transcript_7619/m.14417 type:complete len:107 (-) Transcript_7619:147-467(-)
MILETALEHVLDESMPKLEKNTRQLNYFYTTHNSGELHANHIQDNAQLPTSCRRRRILGTRVGCWRLSELLLRNENYNKKKCKSKTIMTPLLLYKKARRTSQKNQF